ncbi:hypothetical protein [Helicobacter sp. MIT 05-5294]|uniref:hypothetical protein n=1 Tax=Helicobacter sp. MIT 05-5294 TaxID=1548150 RepID=UPI00051FD2A3|nr:hypothetical protein [Helicobacter sp. MIT 05-5294]TLD85471.1 hypothetical protein LS69_009385 [Helicobacter sp. MIT 05-5294]
MESIENVNYNDMPEFVGDIEAILQREGAGSVSEEYIWEIAKQNNSMPNFTAIFLECLFWRFADFLEYKGLRCNFEVNFLASWFEIENKPFEMANDFYQALDELGVRNG